MAGAFEIGLDRAGLDVAKDHQRRLRGNKRGQHGVAGVARRRRCQLDHEVGPGWVAVRAVQVQTGKAGADPRKDERPEGPCVLPYSCNEMRDTIALELRAQPEVVRAIVCQHDKVGMPLTPVQPRHC